MKCPDDIEAERERFGRSPSRGAWIEIYARKLLALRAYSRSPSRGAWIEMDVPDPDIIKSSVAPPRGERGLK